MLGLFAALLLRALTLARVARDRGGVFLILAVCGMMFFSVVVNASMMIGLAAHDGDSRCRSSPTAAPRSPRRFLAIGLILGVDYRRFANA